MTAPLRPFGYCRVSTRDQAEEGYSLDAQERAIRDYCAAHGWATPTVYVDAGRSGYTDVTEKRPAFAAMLHEAESSACDVVVVHKLDRFARSLVTTLRELKRLQSANVAFVSISEALDFTTPIGRVILSVLAAFAEYFSANLSTEVKKGLAERRAAGFRHSVLPYGARWVEGGPALEVDPMREEALRLLLQTMASGSYNAAVAALNEGNHPARRGGSWNSSSVRAVLGAAGWLAEQPDPWPELYANAVKRLSQAAVRNTYRTRMFTGLARCGRCGGPVGYQPRDPKPPGFRCQALCGGGPHRAAWFYENRMREIVAQIPGIDALVARAVVLDVESSLALIALQEIRKAQERLGLAYADELISHSIYEARKAELALRERAIPSTVTRSDRRLHEIEAFRDTFAITELPEAQNHALRTIVRRVVIDGDSLVVEWQEDIAPLFAEVHMSN